MVAFQSPEEWYQKGMVQYHIISQLQWHVWSSELLDFIDPFEYSTSMETIFEAIKLFIHSFQKMRLKVSHGNLLFFLQKKNLIQ